MVLVTMEQHLSLGERGISQLGERHSVQGPYSQCWIMGSSGGSKQGWTIPSYAGIVFYTLHGRLKGGKKSWKVIDIKISLKKTFPPAIGGCFIYPYAFFPIPLSLSYYPYRFIPISFSLSLYPFPFIPLALSLSLYPYPIVPTTLSLSLFPIPLSLYLIPSLYICPFIPFLLSISLYPYLQTKPSVNQAQTWRHDGSTDGAVPLT